MKPGVYLAAIAKAIGVDLMRRSLVKAEGAAPAGQGADWNSNCTKQTPTVEFNVSKYKPDGRVYATLLKSLSSAAKLRNLDSELGLVVDLHWIDMHVNPEPSCGDYLPKGMPARLASICNTLLPPPEAGPRGQVPSYKSMIVTSHQNRRNRETPYVRMVLSEEYKEYIQAKSQGSVSWVDPSSEALVDNVRNDLMGELVAVYHKKTLPPMDLALKKPEAEKTAAPAQGTAQTEQTVEQSAALPEETLEKDDSSDDETDKLNGLAVATGDAGGEGSRGPLLPKSGNSQVSASTKSKKQQLQEKRAAAAASRCAASVRRPRRARSRVARDRAHLGSRRSRRAPLQESQGQTQTKGLVRRRFVRRGTRVGR